MTTAQPPDLPLRNTDGAAAVRLLGFIGGAELWWQNFHAGWIARRFPSSSPMSLLAGKFLLLLLCFLLSLKFLEILRKANQTILLRVYSL